MPMSKYVLTLSCINRPGIVAAVSTYLFKNGGDIREAQQFDDLQTGKFFARIAFDIAGNNFEALQSGLPAVADPFKMSWTLKIGRAHV